MSREKKYLFLFFTTLIVLVGCQNYSSNSSADGPGYSLKLNMSRQNLTEIPEEVYEMTELKILKLFHNKIDSISPKIAQLKNLEKLYLGKNQLKYLPKEISELKNLKILSVGYNELEELPASIGEMTELEQLWVDQNRLKAFPKELGQLENLKTLKANYNFIDTLYKEVFDAKNLEFIHLERNRINSIPNSISQLTGLKELYINNAGFLLNLPESLCDLRRMEVLAIDRTTVVPSCLLTMRTTRLQIIVK